MINKAFSKAQLDALKEIANVGTGCAATALSKLTEKMIAVTVPEVNVVPVSAVPRSLGGLDAPIVGLFFKISGDLSGRMLLVFPKEMADTLIRVLTATLSGAAPGEVHDREVRLDGTRQRPYQFLS